MEQRWRKRADYLCLLYIPVYLIWFFLIERRTGPYWVSYLPVDDRIPFVAAFVVPYVMWYPMLFGAGLYALMRDRAAYRRYMTYTIAALSCSLLICTVFPNGQALRPDLAGREDVFSRLVAFLYACDTPTNSVPSMHVVGAFGAVACVFDCASLRKWRVPAVLLGLLICASTVFIKQHSVLDTLAGLAVAAIFAAPVYGRVLWRKKQKV